MKHLTRIIGPAPSELSPEAFVLTRLKPERTRQERSLANFRAGAVPSWSKKKPKAPKKASGRKGPTPAQIKQLSQLAACQGLTLDELLETLKGADLT